MTVNAFHGSEHAADLRKKAGEWLRELREKEGMTQLELARLVGWKYYSYVSQIESGEKGRVPPDKYEDWARAVGMPADEFVKGLLRFYDPFAFKILFGRTQRGKHSGD